MVQQPPRPAVHHDNGGGAEKVQACRPTNHQQLARGIRHILPPTHQLIYQRPPGVVREPGGGPDMEGLEGHVQPPPQESQTQDTLSEGGGFVWRGSHFTTRPQHRLCH